LPEPVYEALRKIAFDERVKIHDVVVEIDATLRRRGYPTLRVSRPRKNDSASLPDGAQRPVCTRLATWREVADGQEPQ
jgi:hypothetical protein